MAITSYEHFFPEVVARLPGCPHNLIEQQLSQAGRMLCNQSLANIQHLSLDLIPDRLTYDLVTDSTYMKSWTPPSTTEAVSGTIDHEIQKVWAVRTKAGDSIVSSTNLASVVVLSGDVTDRYFNGGSLSLLGTDANDGNYIIVNPTIYSSGSTNVYVYPAPADESTGAGTAGVVGAMDGTAISPSKYRFELPNTLVFTSAPSSEEIANGLQVDVAVAPKEDLADYTHVNFDFINRWSETIKAGALMRLFRMEDRIWSSEAQARQCEVDYKYGLAEARREAYTQFVARDLKIVAPSFL